ncbi:hypothetical protein L6R50_14640 [Myxococcota bacterium]|nr:hypothetical protein [Myxococcota bacterium]
MSTSHMRLALAILLGVAVPGCQSTTSQDDDTADDDTADDDAADDDAADDDAADDDAADDDAADDDAADDDMADDDSADPLGVATVTWSGEVDGFSFAFTTCGQGIGPSDNVTLQLNGIAEIRCSVQDAAAGLLIAILTTPTAPGTYDHTDPYNPTVAFERYPNEGGVVYVRSWQIASPAGFSVVVDSWDEVASRLVGSVAIDQTNGDGVRATLSGVFDATF